MNPARPGPSATRALAWLYAPEPQRPLLAALWALEAEIGASLQPGLDHQVARRVPLGSRIMPRAYIPSIRFGGGYGLIAKIGIALYKRRHVIR